MIAIILLLLSIVILFMIISSLIWLAYTRLRKIHSSITPSSIRDLYNKTLCILTINENTTSFNTSKLKGPPIYKFYRKCAEDKKDTRFPCSNKNNGKHMIRAALETAKREICIYTDTLNSPVFLESIDYFSNAKNKGVKIRVLSREMYTYGTVYLKHRLGDGLHIKQPVGNYSADYDVKAKEFMTIDDTGFRFQIKEGVDSFIGSFNDPEVVKKLKESFDKAFDLAQDVKDGIHY